MPRLKQHQVSEDELRNLAASITLALQGSPLPEGFKVSTLLSLAARLAAHSTNGNVSTYFRHSMAAIGTLADSLIIGFGNITVEKKREQSRLKMQRRRARLKKVKKAERTAAQPVKVKRPSKSRTKKR